ncbi:thrombospondin type 3 repeat-containing protein [Patescibacteria group bacterium]|nr:thrombospondin type 3 repeat-containing protein [Patescibacteria group bacterium]MBU4458885.1 thrombospondin type 3 repeat-containing protein [Patescibacteria group bacterium]MCG2696167.1 thrombospondin type 3 repeat-containing protein [Candidatus Portnoybacteria bacterium]
MRLKIKNIPLATIILTSIFAVGLILFVGAFSKRSAFSTYNLWGGKETIIESESKDTDNDGLKDWEENLYKTDPLNPDTDADGYLDGEEINSGHNPLVKGPNDKQVFYPLPIGNKYNITNQIFSDFDAIAKSYIEQKDQYVRDHPEIIDPTTYMAEASKGALDEMLRRAMLYNEADWSDKANAVLEKNPEIFQIEISDIDIKISDDNTPEAIKAYFEKLSSYAKSNNFLLQNENFILLQDSFPNNDFAEVDILIIINDDEISKLVDTPVPSSWKELHKNFLKIAITLRNIFVSLRGFESDPIKAIIANNEIKNVSSLWKSFEQNLLKLNESQNLNLEL